MTQKDSRPGLGQLLDTVPIGVLVVDGERVIRFVNPHAEQLLGCRSGESLDGYVRQEDIPRLEELLRGAGDTLALQLDLAVGSKTVEVTATQDGRGNTLFMSDVSEKVALGRQLKAHRQPSRKLLYQLHSETTSMTGYAELIDLMLDEESVVKGDRLNVVRRYHKEVRKSLETLGRLLKVEREGGRRPDAVTIPFKRKQVAVIDDEPAITEFIAELMRGLQYRVSAFTEPLEALAWCRENSESIDLVIVDHTMPAGEEGRLIENLLALPAEFSIVVCSENADHFPETSRTFLCHKPIDISELTQIVSDVLQDTWGA